MYKSYFENIQSNIHSNRYDILDSTQGKYSTFVTPKDYNYEGIISSDCVGVIPIIKDKVVLRKEFCPPYFTRDKNYSKDNPNLYNSIITGGIELNETSIQAGIREVKEESGIIIKDYDVVNYIEVPIFKNTFVRLHFYILNVKDYIVEKPKGDGTLNEKKSKSYSISINDFISKEVEYKDSLYVFAKEKLQNIYGNLN